MRSVLCSAHRKRVVPYGGRLPCCLADQLNVAMRQNERLREIFKEKARNGRLVIVKRREAAARSTAIFSSEETESNGEDEVDAEEG